MAWIYLIAAGLLEIVWAAGLKYSEGFTRPWISAFTLATMAVGFWLLALSLKQIPLGTGYAIWVGIGAVGTAVLGIVLFGEAASWPRLACIALICAGIVGLKLATP